MFFGIIGTVIIVAAVIAVITLITKKAIKKKQTYCKKCKTKYNFDTDVAWTNLGNVSTPQGTNTKIEFICKCPKCGEKQTFIKEFRSQYIDGNDKVTNLNVNDSIKEFFK